MLGEWWLTRTNAVAICITCSKPIPRQEFQLVYCPCADAEPTLAGKHAVYKQMFEKTQWLYHHANVTGVPPHEVSGVPLFQQLTSRDKLGAEIDFLPKYMEESLADYQRECEETINKAIEAFLFVGHVIEDA